MPRFALLAHDWPDPHWDLLLEAGSVLKAWRVHQPLDAPGPLEIEQNVDHRPLYLDYEGEVSGGRGSVRRDDGGIYEGALGEDLVDVILAGTRYQGRLTLYRHAEKVWWLNYEPVI